jgi:16S rRNA G966 N2-methylase RsmD
MPPRIAPTPRKVVASPPDPAPSTPANAPAAEVAPLSEAVNLAVKNGMLGQGGVIVFEHSADKQFDYAFEGYSVKNKKYGIVSVDFIYRD